MKKKEVILFYDFYYNFQYDDKQKHPVEFYAGAAKFEYQTRKDRLANLKNAGGSGHGRKDDVSSEDSAVEDGADQSEPETATTVDRADDKSKGRTTDRRKGSAKDTTSKPRPAVVVPTPSKKSTKTKAAVTPVQPDPVFTEEWKMDMLREVCSHKTYQRLLEVILPMDVRSLLSTYGC